MLEMTPINWIGILLRIYTVPLTGDRNNGYCVSGGLLVYSFDESWNYISTKDFLRPSIKD